MAPIAEPDLVSTPNDTTEASKKSAALLADRLYVQRSDKPFASGAISRVSLPPGALFARITGASIVPKQRYTTVQINRNQHIELNSDLVYCNHSCRPSVVFDMAKMEVRVVDDRPLKEGEPVTFFYPSTEWEMDQPFQCNCGAGNCKGWIDGAKKMSREELQGYWLNDHIVELLKERDGA